jgi:hypothetical protein
MIASRFALLAGAALTFTHALSLGQTTRVLSPDLALFMYCPDKDVASVERAIEEFLGQEGFRVLNLEKIRREHGRPFYALEINGLDSKRRILHFIGFTLPEGRGRYHIVLNTQPPTQRSTELEAKLESFPTGLECSVRQLNRGSNDASARDMHDSEVTRVEGLFREADALKGKYKL